MVWDQNWATYDDTAAAAPVAARTDSVGAVVGAGEDGGATRTGRPRRGSFVSARFPREIITNLGVTEDATPAERALQVADLQGENEVFLGSC